MTTIRRTSQTWLIGDVCVPKVNPTLNRQPSSYYTDITVIKPVIQPPPGFGWSTVPSNKQAACRHNGRAVYSACDAHVESGRWVELSQDANDVFAVNSF